MKYRIIVFEGGDCTGKSSLKKKLELSTNFLHLCVDRMFITSIVYNRFKKRHPEIEEQLYTDLDLFIKTMNPLFVVLTVDKDIQEKRYEGRGDWYIKSEELRALAEGYDELLSELRLKYPNNFLVLQNNDESDQEKNVEMIKNKCGEVE